ncbi:hypothetical protein KY320_03195 [Candidatus Woesearchaeota archaeon]|nr:hypothetical protein [Candidatus Woesearchaeota archaeon]
MDRLWLILGIVLLAIPFVTNAIAYKTVISRQESNEYDYGCMHEDEIHFPHIMWVTTLKKQVMDFYPPEEAFASYLFAR